MALPLLAIEPAPPEGLVTGTNASEGNTELEAGGLSTVADKPEDTKDEQSLEASAGGLVSTGNARAQAFTGLVKYRLRRDIHQFRSELAVNYGLAAPNPAADLTANVSNIQMMARYDAFFAERWSGFIMAGLRNDPFQGLTARFNLDPGVAFYALTDPKQRLWFEAGYDFQFDSRTDDGQFLRSEDGEFFVDEDGVPVDALEDRVRSADPTFTNHAIRLFAGYTNNMNEHVTFDTGLEYLPSVIDSSIFRVNWTNSLTASIGGNFSLSTAFTLRYENSPLPGVEKLDTITSVLLGLRFI